MNSIKHVSRNTAPLSTNGSANGPDALLTIEKLTVHYSDDVNRIHVLDAVDLEVGRGSVQGLIGESGCGKSTLAKSILGVLPSSARIVEGRIVFLDRDLLALSEREMCREVRGKHVVLIPQEPMASLNPVFKIGSQIIDIVLPKLAAQRTGLPSRKRRIVRRLLADKLTEVQLPVPERILNSYPHELSGGQQQRILIAVALLLNPDLILADEPTQALDVTVEAQILELLGDLLTEYRTSTLYITHDLAVASSICTHIAVMYCGQLVEVAESGGFFARPTHPYSRMLLACLPKRNEELRGIPGRVSSLIDPPVGCRFNPRCDVAEPVCSQERPTAYQVGKQHTVYCHTCSSAMRTDPREHTA